MGDKTRKRLRQQFGLRFAGRNTATLHAHLTPTLTSGPDWRGSCLRSCTTRDRTGRHVQRAVRRPKQPQLEMICAPHGSNSSTWSGGPARVAVTPSPSRTTRTSFHDSSSSRLVPTNSSGSGMMFWWVSPDKTRRPSSSSIGEAPPIPDVLPLLNRSSACCQYPHPPSTPGRPPERCT